ncbi:hypothetical protein HGT73_11570 [Rosenbergiella australiborealis]|uniref:Glycosyltransferase (GlcNAc) n=1 Tax=Rosenbergiella australiborealis TaxID=1544696 RepID=A0ABS5T6L1_9GAMM|nr:GlcNAc-transferase family protein [Rosenbergiella australiborealis]MBT0728003.1 hypothetical protein [Rosenbergiella australiborealis]
MDKTLFINIASYRDHELWSTVESLLATASAPDKLHIAICWQDDNDLSAIQQKGWVPVPVSSLAGFPVYRLDGSAALIELIALPYQHAQGVGFARALCDQLYRDEQWFLQIDAHSLFAKDWDARLINTLTGLSQQSAKPLISGYPPSYHVTEAGEIHYGQDVGRVTFNRFTAEKLPTLTSQKLCASQPVKGSFVAAGFIFTQGAFVKEVGNDPTLFFEGEEITLSLRAYSWGYDVFHIPDRLLWHHYTRPTSPKIWEDHSPGAQERGEISVCWLQREAQSQRRVKALLGLVPPSPTDKAAKALGPTRARRQFEYQCGLNFSLASCYAECLAPSFDCDFLPPRDEEEWVNWHRHYYSKPLNLGALLGMPAAHVLPDKLILHLYAQNNTRLAYREFTRAQLGATHIEVSGWSTPNCPPAFLRLASWWQDSGWGNVIQQPWSEDEGPYCLL